MATCTYHFESLREVKILVTPISIYSTVKLEHHSYIHSIAVPPLHHCSDVCHIHLCMVYRDSRGSKYWKRDMTAYNSLFMQVWGREEVQTVREKMIQLPGPPRHKVGKEMSTRSTKDMHKISQNCFLHHLYTTRTNCQSLPLSSPVCPQKMCSTPPTQLS